MTKVDIKNAFRLCPVHPEDWPLLGYKFLGKYYFDICLLFGCRSFPFIFNSFADSLAWILVQKFHITDSSYGIDRLWFKRTTSLLFQFGSLSR